MSSTSPNKVNIKAFSTLRRYVEDTEGVDVALSKPETVADVLGRVGIPTEQSRIIFVDGRKSDLTQVLAGGENVSVFPAIGGG